LSYRAKLFQGPPDIPLTSFLGGVFPKDSHKAIITEIPQGLIALVSFYGGDFTTIVILCPPTGSGYFGGMICDWRSMKELSMMEFLSLFAGA
jgi:hypothetical protein